MLANLVELITTAPIAGEESEHMNQEDCNIQQTSSGVQQKIIAQSEREVLDYWTPERMRNAKPLNPTVTDTFTVPESHTKEASSSSISAPGSDI